MPEHHALPLRAGALLPLMFLLTACGNGRSTLVISGTVEIRQVAVAALAGGRLVQLRVDEGDTVRAGDTVAVLTRPGLAERIAEARARAAALRARVRDLEAGARPQELATARAALEAAIADSVRRARDHARIQRLSADSVATPAQLDAARSAAESAAAQVRQARESLDLTAAGPRAQQLTAARHDADAAAALAAARAAEAADFVLTAPDSGIVLLRLAEPGEVLPAGTPVVTLGLTRAPWVRAFVAQGVIGRVAVGRPVTVRADTWPDTAFAGTVTEIAPRAEFIPRAALTERERADLVFAIRVGIADHAGRLKAGMPVDLEIVLLP